jgi:ferritin
MISKSMADRLINHLNLEFYSYYRYLALSAFFRAKSLNGMGRWFAAQAEEERTHAMKIYKYLLDVDADVVLQPIAAPKSDFDAPLPAFQDALAHEQKVTAAINDLVGAAFKENDYATHIFLQWFITEQIEEEATVRDIVESLKLVGSSGDGILMLDRELGARQAGAEGDAEEA